MTDTPVPEREGKIHFVQYADVLGGSPGREDEKLFQEANGLISRLDPEPDFLIFNGDHIAGYSAIDELHRQWDYFLSSELPSFSFPVHHIPGNHDVVSLTKSAANPYGRAFPNREAEDLFRSAFPDLPCNGPPGQEGLSYYVEGEDYILITLHPIFSQRSSTGFKETEWLDAVLTRYRNKPYKIVASHFPVFPVNGYDRHAPYPHASWIIDPEDTAPLWDLFVTHGVRAYLCAHVCAFDFQIHRNIPQICSAGRGHLWR